MLFSVGAYCHADPLWLNTNLQVTSADSSDLRVYASKLRRLEINSVQLSRDFSNINTTTDIILPLPNGHNVSVKLTPSPILSEALKQQFPTFMTYSAEQHGQPQNIGRFSISHLGLFGFFRYNDKWMMLSPKYQVASQEYASYWYQDSLAPSAETKRITDYLLKENQDQLPQLAHKKLATGDTIRTYKLAISTTAEYTQRLGGTTANVVAELMNLVNRINQILRIDLALQFELIDNLDIIFFNAQDDPFTNADAATDIEVNQQVIDEAIGNQNYDIGHVLGTNGGGLAYVGVVCNSNFKAQGYTGISNPQGERFYIDLVAHELGHQLGARHSFNAIDSGSCADGRSSSTAYEPGSGSTIMAYAGICDEQDLQSISDPYFHAISIQNIRNYVESFSAQNCGVNTDNNNAIPQIQLNNTAYTIPANTPFVLNAQAADGDNDPLTYTWEQFDNGGISGATRNVTELNSDNGHNPLFRSFNPVNTTQRYFPKLDDVIAGQTSKGETYANTDRDLRFRLTARDNKGGVDQQDLVVTVSTANQSFSLDNPQLWTGLTEQIIRWDVGDTTDDPVNCANVDIQLDSDNDRIFELNLAMATINDGQHAINVPNIASDNARLMLRCSDNIFYAITAEPFTIIAVQPVAPIINSQKTLSLAEDSQLTITLSDINVTDGDSSYPEDFSLTVFDGENYNLNQQTLTPNADFNGLLSVNVQVNDGELSSNIFALEIQVIAVNDPPVANDESRSIQQNSSQISIDVLANDQDVDGDSLTILSFSYSGQGRVNIANSQLTYTPANGFSGNESFTYLVTDGEFSDQGTVTIRVNASAESTNTSSGGSLYLLTVLLFLCLSTRLACHILCKDIYE